MLQLCDSNFGFFDTLLDWGGLLLDIYELIKA